MSKIIWDIMGNMYFRNDGPDYRKGSVLKQKLSNSFKEELKEKYVKRLSSQPVNVNQELPDVIWVHTSSPEVVVVERKMPMPAARRSPVLKEVTSRSENTGMFLLKSG